MYSTSTTRWKTSERRERAVGDTSLGDHADERVRRVVRETEKAETSAPGTYASPFITSHTKAQRGGVCVSVSDGWVAIRGGTKLKAEEVVEAAERVWEASCGRGLL